MMSMVNSPRGLRYESGRRKGKRAKPNARLVFNKTNKVFHLVSTAIIEEQDEILWDYGEDYSLVAVSSTNPVEPSSPTVIDLVTPPHATTEDDGWTVCSGEYLTATDDDESWTPGLWDPHDPSSERPPEYQHDEWHGFSYMQIMSGEAFDNV
jgi:hypothetical protein